MHTGWLDASNMSDTAEELILYKVGPSQSNSMTVIVLFNLSITCHFNWSLYYLGESIDISRCSLFDDSPALLNDTSSINSVINKIENCKVCIGSPDEKFDLLVKFRQGIFKDQSGSYMYI